MGFVTVTNTFTNSTTADATQVNQNFTDLVNGTSDGTKDFNINAITAAGTATLNGDVILGSASNDVITPNGSFGGHILFGSQHAYDIGTSAVGVRSIYFGDSSAGAFGTRIIGADISSGWTLTLPVSGGADKYTLATNGSGVSTWQAPCTGIDVLTNDATPDGSADYVPTYDASASGPKKVLLSKVGALVLLQTQTASSSSSIDFTSGIDSAYDEYIFVAKDVVPSSNTANFWMRLSENAGGAWESDASDYRYAIIYGVQAASGGNIGSTGAAQILIANSLGNSTGQSLDLVIRLFVPSGSGKNKILVGEYAYLPSDGAFQIGKVGGLYTGSTNAINGVRFLMSTSTIASGSFSLYGVRKA